MRFLIAAALCALLALVQIKIRGGEGSSIEHVKSLQMQLSELQRQNSLMREQNAQLLAEIKDLQEGTEVLEEQARSELGMVKPNEVLIQMR